MEAVPECGLDRALAIWMPALEAPAEVTSLAPITDDHAAGRETRLMDGPGEIQLTFQLFTGQTSLAARGSARFIGKVHVFRL